MPLLRSFTMVGAAVAASLALAAPARAQMLGAPVLQNAFTNRGFTFGLDFGAGTDAQTYGGAVAWAPMSARYQLSGGVAYINQKDRSGTATYGARLMVPVLDRTSAFGVAPFVGMGGANFSGVNDWQIPLGISAGYRRAVGTNGRGISAYVSPFYTWARVRENGQTITNGLFRVSVGVDAAVLPQVGVSVGVETGKKAGQEDVGTRGTIFGVGVSYALHKPGTGIETDTPRRRKRRAVTDSTDATP
ncbi:MAG: hypothetical protein H0U66_15080 [Gemmatimonadaceae bacterium]|nr:hypothetical protein [Gemmatimonadaceae bacterium]